MYERTLVSLRFALVLTTIAIFAWSARSQPESTAGKLKKAMADLGSSNFRTRQKGENALIELSDAALPILRLAETSDVALETKRRIENLIEQIENNLLAVEAKNWQTLDAPPYVKDRLVKIMSKQPPLSEPKRVIAIYLITTNRQPTQLEAAQALKDLQQSNSLIISALRVARPLVRSNGNSVELVHSYAKVLKARENRNAYDMYGNLFDQATTQFGMTLGKATLPDEDLANLIYLFVLSRHPEPEESKQIVSALQRTADRTNTTTALVRVLQKTEEFQYSR